MKNVYSSICRMLLPVGVDLTLRKPPFIIIYHCIGNISLVCMIRNKVTQFKARTIVHGFRRPRLYLTNLHRTFYVVTGNGNTSLI